jgi:membrane protease YdiL (CAAX protease family)
MAVGSKSFPLENRGGGVEAGRAGEFTAGVTGGWQDWIEITLVFVLLEVVLWTPRSVVHGGLIALVVGGVLWLSLRRNSRKELGLVWPSGRSTLWIVAAGALVASAIPVGAGLTGHPVPANSEWPTLGNILPYIVWAFGQQFLLQSFFFLRLESRMGARWAVVSSSVLFTLAHLPNMALTAMTIFGALFFTGMFRRYRSIYPLGIAHGLLGLAIAYSFPDRVMHHMRVGLGYWQFH